MRTTSFVGSLIRPQVVRVLSQTSQLVGQDQVRSAITLSARIAWPKHANKIEVLDVVRQMAGQYADEQIAATLNRLGLRTGWNNTWNKQRVRDLRSKLQLPAFDETQADRTMLTMEQAAERLHTSPAMIKRLIASAVTQNRPMRVT